jgi:hypothetical protein
MLYMRFKILVLLFLCACSQTCVRNSTQTAPTQQKAKTQEQRLSRAPSYCQALVSLDQVSRLNRFVVDTYNKAIARPHGFTLAKYNEDGSQPVVTFANPQKPSLYYSENNGHFHSSLCNGPNSPFFRCSDPIIFDPISSIAVSSDPMVAYANYYEPKVKAMAFDYESPSEMGALFVALPLMPKNLSDSSGHLISGLMHVSLVKIWTAGKDMDPKPGAKSLRDRFVNALKTDFAGYRSRLPEKIRLDEVLCRP